MIETTKWFKMEQVVKISWFAAILTSGFIYLNGGHIENKVKIIICRYNESHTHVPSDRRRNIVK